MLRQGLVPRAVLLLSEHQVPDVVLLVGLVPVVVPGPGGVVLLDGLVGLVVLGLVPPAHEMRDGAKLYPPGGLGRPTVLTGRTLVIVACIAITIYTHSRNCGEHAIFEIPSLVKEGWTFLHFLLLCQDNFVNM